MFVGAPWLNTMHNAAPPRERHADRPRCYMPRCSIPTLRAPPYRCGGGAERGVAAVGGKRAGDTMARPLASAFLPPPTGGVCAQRAWCAARARRGVGSAPSAQRPRKGRECNARRQCMPRVLSGGGGAPPSRHRHVNGGEARAPNPRMSMRTGQRSYQAEAGGWNRQCTARKSQRRQLRAAARRKWCQGAAVKVRGSVCSVVCGGVGCSRTCALWRRLRAAPYRPRQRPSR